MRSGLGAGRVAARLSDSLVPPPYHCPACYCSISSTPRTYATTALATETTTTTEADHSPAAPQAAAHSTRPFPSYALHAGILLTRAPLLTRPLSSFEAAYFLYQRRLNERLALPFTRYFYFKKDTPADVEWKRKAKDRRTPAREIGAYDAYGRTAWADELLVGAPESAPEWQVAALLQDAEVPGAGAGAGVAVTGAADGLADKNAVALVETGIEVAARAPDADRPMSRQTAADRAGDATSLDRLLDRTLYLLVRSADGRWVLPSVRLLPRENLHQGAERAIVQAAGANMNTWVVGNVPVGHYTFDFPTGVVQGAGDDDASAGARDADAEASAGDANADTSRSSHSQQRVEVGEKVFFLKARVLAGQADLARNALGLREFRWLARDEVRALVTPRYWAMTGDMLAER